jgi:uncharacterized membrane protein YeiH
VSARRAPLYSYLAAVAFGAAALGAVPVLVLGLDLDARWSRVMAFAACAVAGLAFAWQWPLPSWRWGLWVSSGFWLFFATVFAAMLARGEPEWSPLLDAVGVIAFACAGAALGRRAAR